MTTLILAPNLHDSLPRKRSFLDRLVPKRYRSTSKTHTRNQTSETLVTSPTSDESGTGTSHQQHSVYYVDIAQKPGDDLETRVETPVPASARKEGFGTITPSVQSPQSPTFSMEDHKSSPPRPPSRTRLFSFESRPHTAREDSNHNRQGSIAPFNEYALPAQHQVEAVSSMTVYSENGMTIRFGDLWKNNRTLVIFIRHYWCNCCQDFVRSLETQPLIMPLERVGVKIIIIGLGAYSLIKRFRQITGCGLPIYCDPTLRIQRTLGMTLKTTHSKKESFGSFTNAPHDEARSLVKTIRRRMSFESGGDSTQLGGEFILGPGLGCNFAHRMTQIRAHLPIGSLAVAAGADVATSYESHESRFSAITENTLEDEEAWMDRRRLSFARMRERKRERRGAPWIDYDSIIAPADSLLRYELVDVIENADEIDPESNR